MKLRYVAASIAMFGFVGGTLWAYNSYVGQGGDRASVPLIRAEMGAYKTQPEDRGGAEIPHRDSAIYDVLDGEASIQDEEVSFSETPHNADSDDVEQSAESGFAAMEKGFVLGQSALDTLQDEEAPAVDAALQEAGTLPVVTTRDGQKVESVFGTSLHDAPPLDRDIAIKDLKRDEGERPSIVPAIDKETIERAKRAIGEEVETAEESVAQIKPQDMPAEKDTEISASDQALKEATEAIVSDANQAAKINVPKPMKKFSFGDEAPSKSKNLGEAGKVVVAQEQRRDESSALDVNEEEQDAGIIIQDIRDVSAMDDKVKAPLPLKKPTPPATENASSPAQNKNSETVVYDDRLTHFVQLASTPDRRASQAHWDKLRGEFPAILGGQPVRFFDIEIEGRGTFTRVQLGPYERSRATSLCSDLDAAGYRGGCIVLAR
jgi:hypothetical protein